MTVLAQFVELVFFWYGVIFFGPLILIGVIWLVATFVEGWFSRKNFLGLAGFWAVLAVVIYFMIRMALHHA